MARGEMALEQAETKADFSKAAKEFEEVIRYAPKWADGYYNLGFVQDKAGQYDESVRNLKKYLDLAPNNPDAEKVRTFMYKVEYKKDLEQSKIKKMAGKWRYMPKHGGNIFKYFYTFNFSPSYSYPNGSVTVPKCSKWTKEGNSFYYYGDCYGKVTTQILDGALSYEFYQESCPPYDSCRKTKLKYRNLKLTDDTTMQGERSQDGEAWEKAKLVKQ